VWAKMKSGASKIAKSIYRGVQQRSLENLLKRELVFNFGYDNKLAIAEVLVQKIVEILDLYAPEKETVRPLQAVWMAVDREETPSRGKTAADQEHRTVVVDLWEREEIDRLVGGANRLDLLPGRVARLTKQAFAQNGVLTVVDLSLLTGVSTAAISRALADWQEAHGEVLPIRGTIHDTGMSTSHKKEIIELHLQGHLTSEIARRTSHDPTNVERYIRNFERVLDFAREGIPVQKICFYTGLGPRLVKEYRTIAEHYQLLPNEQKVGIT